jgi:DNA transposition AAA+ family ATPase
MSLNGSTNTSPANTSAEGAPDLEELRARVAKLMRAQQLSTAGLAKLIGKSKTSVVAWLTGSNGRPMPQIDAAMREWVRETERHVHGTPEFVATPSSTRITAALAHAQANGDLVCVYGAPGTGKTRTIEHYRESFANTWVATITPASAAVVPALEEVAEAVGIHDVCSGARRLSRAIRAKVRDLDGLLVIDEAQHLSLGAIEELRGIHDATGVGLALVGNELVYARLTGGSRAVHFAQLFSRVGLRLYLRRPEKRDVRAITEHWEVTDPKALELLDRVSARPGALRAITKILRLASVGGRAVTAERVRAAMDHLGTEDA